MALGLAGDYPWIVARPRQKTRTMTKWRAYGFEGGPVGQGMG